MSSVTLVHTAKAAGRNEMLFGQSCGPKYHCIRQGPTGRGGTLAHSQRSRLSSNHTGAVGYKTFDADVKRAASLKNCTQYNHSHPSEVILTSVQSFSHQYSHSHRCEIFLSPVQSFSLQYNHPTAVKSFSLRYNILTSVQSFSHQYSHSHPSTVTPTAVKSFSPQYNHSHSSTITPPP